MAQIRELKADEIEARIAQVGAKGCSILLYKTARADMAVLDETFGAENWQCKYEEIKGNLFCSIGVRYTPDGEWIWKQDCGIESREDDGNEKKGEASDSFKRAAFKIGIGRALYTSPFIFIGAETTFEGGRYKLKKMIYPTVSEIKYCNGKISKLVIKNGETVIYTFPKGAIPDADGAALPATDAKLLREQILSIGGGDVKRIDAFVALLYPGAGLDDLDAGQLSRVKVELARSVNKARESK